MSKNSYSRYELGRKTTTDVLESEKADVDEIETMQMAKKDEGRSVDYKKRHQDFLNKTKFNDENIDLNEVKKIQMQVYSSNSSEAYNLTSKTSIFLTVLSVVFAILLFAVILVYIVFNAVGYRLLKYDRDDMSGVIENGDVLFIQNAVYEISVDDVVIYKTGDGTEMARIVREYGDEVILNTPNNDGYIKISISEVDSKLSGFVKSRMGGFGSFLMFLVSYWFYFVGGLFILMLACFVTKLLIDRHYNMLLINKLEVEREQMEKRRKYLAETIVKMQQTKNVVFDNVNVLSGLLNVNKTPDNRRERKMKKLQNQLKQRQQKQIESIKNGQDKQEINEQKQKEKQVVEFLREEISAQEQESKTKLTDEEIEKRKKIAEETNKNLSS